MSNRKRNIQILFCVTPEEKKLIRQKMILSKTRNMGAYLRKMAIDGYIINTDTAPIKQLYAEMHKIGVNINQIAHAANATQTISADEVKIIQQQQKEIWELLNRLLSTTIPYLEDYPYET